MKHISRLFFAVLAIVACSPHAGADVIDGINYSLNTSKLTATVWSAASGSPYKGDVVIPATVTDSRGRVYKVTEVTTSAFNRAQVTSVTLPEGLLVIGNSAFVNSTVESVNIPWTVTTIGYNAFMSCEKLKSILIPPSVTSIGEQTFYKSYGIEEAVIMCQAELPMRMFEDCYNLQKVVIGNQVTTMYHSVFKGCWGLMEEKAGDGVYFEDGSKVPYFVSGLAKTFGRTQTTPSKYHVKENSIRLYAPSDATEIEKDKWAALTYHSSRNANSPFMSVTHDITTGIDDVTADESEAQEAEAVYYDMRGARVSGTLAPGLYIERRGNKVTKVMIH